MGFAASLCHQSGDRYSWVSIPASACVVCTHAVPTQCTHSEHAVRTQCNNLAKACFRPYLRVFHLSWVFGAGERVGGSPKGLVHYLLMHFFTLGSSKVKVSETYFFVTAIT